MSTNDNELNHLLNQFDELKNSNKINLVPEINTRSLYGVPKPEVKRKELINDIPVDNSLNRVPEPQISGLYYRADIGDNRVDVSKATTNYDNVDYNNKQPFDHTQNQMQTFTKNSYAVGRSRDGNMAAITKRDDYMRYRPTGNLFQEGQEKLFFTQSNPNYPNHKEFFNNIKNNVTQDNTIDYENETSHGQKNLAQEEF